MFLKVLETNLSTLPEGERKDILSDYQEYFDVGKSEGKSEEEIAKKLGNPKQIAKELKTMYHLDQLETEPSTSNFMRAVIGTISLSFFNLVFVLGPFLALVGVFIAFYAAAAVLTLAPFLQLIDLLLIREFEWFPFFASLAFSGLGILLLIGLLHATRAFFHLFMKYLQWNFRIVKGVK